MVAYYGCHKKLQFCLKFLVLSNAFWNNLMLSRTKCFLNKKPLLNPLLTFICHFFEDDPPSRYFVLDWAFGVDDFLMDLVFELLWSIFIHLRGDHLRGCLLPFWFFIVRTATFTSLSCSAITCTEYNLRKRSVRHVAITL